jgi:hypothetical protein
MQRAIRFWGPAGVALLALLAFGMPAGATPFTGTLQIFGSTAGLGGDSTSTTTPNVVTVPTGATTAGLPTTATLTTRPTGGAYGYNIKIEAQVNPLGAGSFSGTTLAGLLAVPGAIVATLTNYNNYLVISMPLTSGGAGVGLGGTVTAAPIQGDPWSVQGGPWTTGPAVVYNTVGGATTLTLTGYDNRNAAGLGMVQLVTPVQLQLATSSVGTHGVLTLNFVPEPGTLLLVGTGLAGIALLSRRRR